MGTLGGTGGQGLCVLDPARFWPGQASVATGTACGSLSYTCPHPYTCASAGEGLPRGGPALRARRPHPLQPGRRVRQHWGRATGKLSASATASAADTCCLLLHGASDEETWQLVLAALRHCFMQFVLGKWLLLPLCCTSCRGHVPRLLPPHLASTAVGPQSLLFIGSPAVCPGAR